MALSEDQFGALDVAREVHIETRANRGTIATIIWVVVANDQVYVRSVRGDGGRWYQRALADPSVAIQVNGERIEFRAVHVDDPDTIQRVSEALRDKYPPGGSLDRMTRAEVLDMTLRLDPVS